VKVALEGFLCNVNQAGFLVSDTEMTAQGPAFESRAHTLLLDVCHMIVTGVATFYSHPNPWACHWYSKITTKVRNKHNKRRNDRVQRTNKAVEMKDSDRNNKELIGNTGPGLVYFSCHGILEYTKSQVVADTGRLWIDCHHSFGGARSSGIRPNLLTMPVKICLATRLGITHQLATYTS